MNGPKPLFAEKKKTLQRVTSYPHAEANAVIVKPKAARHPVLSDIDGFGRDVVTRTSSVNNSLLEMTKTSSLQELGGRLTEIIVISKQLDPKDLKEGGFLSKLWTNAKLKKEQFFAKHRTVKEQIGKVVEEVRGQAKKMDDQIKTLDAMYAANEQDYQTFGDLMEQCKAALEDLKAELDALVAEEATDEFHGQRIADKRAEINRLEKKIVNFELNRTMAFQTAPQIRLMQESARQMIGTFRDVVDVTIPAWEKQFSLQILHMEQQTAVKVADTVHDATNEMVKRNASMLRQNAGDVARVANRQVVEIETLEFAQNELIGAITDVNNVVNDAIQKRSQTFKRAGELREELVQKLKG
jgi:uncharacterized protein YaaN involved in tellurite resistance